MQAPGLYFSEQRNLRGICRLLGFGPLGVELKNRVKELWWDFMVRRREDVVGMDGSILMHPQIWVASGHVESFFDPLVDCKACKKRFRADMIEQERKCPECGGELTEPRNFNLMFKTHVGPVEDDASIAYLRPETAQAIYVNYKNIQQAMRLKLPFGIGPGG